MTDIGFAPFAVPYLVDPHYHGREGAVLGPLLKAAREGCSRVVGLMPNTKDGLLTAEQVLAYVAKCLQVGPSKEDLDIIPYVQITEQTDEREILACLKEDVRDAKVYPKDRTTRSHLGVRDYQNVLPIIVFACKQGMRVHFHPEHPMMMFENRDAEYLFLPIMDTIMRETAGLPGQIIWEHGTDARCISFWKEWAKTGRFFVTLTAHHLAASENETYGDVQAACKPTYKTRQDQYGLCALVAEDHEWVMAGSDSAFHPKGPKHTLGPCACGAFTAPFLLALYAHALRPLLLTPRGQDVFIRFTSGNAARLYGYDTEEDWPMATIVDAPMQIPKEYRIGKQTAEPFWAGQEISCSIQ